MGGIIHRGKAARYNQFSEYDLENEYLIFVCSFLMTLLGWRCDVL